MKIKKIIIIDAIILLIGGIGILLFYLISHIETKKPNENPLLLNNLTIKDKYLIKDKQYVFTTVVLPQSQTQFHALLPFSTDTF